MWVIDTLSAGTTHRSISRIKPFVQGWATPKPLSFKIQNQSEKRKGYAYVTTSQICPKD